MHELYRAYLGSRGLGLSVYPNCGVSGSGHLDLKISIFF